MCMKIFLTCIHFEIICVSSVQTKPGMAVTQPSLKGNDNEAMVHAELCVKPKTHITHERQKKKGKSFKASNI